MKKRQSILILLLSLVLLLSGCGGNGGNQPADGNNKENGNNATVNNQEEAKDDKEESGYPVSWKENFEGTDVDFSVEEAPKKAISMSMATTEMMLALGLEDQMVGTAFLEEDILPELKDAYDKVEVLSDKWPSYEVFMSKEPDFATGWPVPFTKRGIEHDKITGEGVPIFIPNSFKEADADLEMNFEDLLMYGKIFGKEENAEKLVASQKEKLEKVKEKIKDLPEKSIFVFDSEDEQPFTVFEGYTTNVLNLIGCKNILAGKGSDQTWGNASWEEIVAGNPESIIVVDYGVSIRNTDDFDAKVEKIKANPMLKDVDAVKNNSFIRVKLSEITPGVRTVDALTRIAEEIHGVTLD
ncbi:MAG: ABC transporter substrate-binding protein [Tissierellia bacterium]|nr:ABC transporter substrate-binding protein [Tissierellia bacterium]